MRVLLFVGYERLFLSFLAKSLAQCLITDYSRVCSVVALRQLRYISMKNSLHTELNHQMSFGKRIKCIQLETPLLMQLAYD
jgi:hypothetical protein